jgi:formylglycine-generating enzyme
MPEPSKGIGMNTELPPPAGTNYLLAIAIDEYAHLPRLYNCRRDAEALIQLLTENYSFEPANVTALFDAEATLDQIDAVFEHLIDRVKPNDNLVIYYSGHGEYSRKRQEGFWIPVDAGQGKYTQYLANDSIRRFVNQIKTYHTFLISDSCFSGSLFESGKGKDTGHYLEEDPSRWVLTAGRNEIVSDGKPGANSPFAEALQYQLKKDRDFLGVAELCVNVQKEVKAGAFGKTNQLPVFGPLHVEGNKFGQFVFRRKKMIVAAPKSDQQEAFAWQIARSAHSFAGYQEYLRLFPNGAHYLEAIDLLGQLIGKAEAPPAPAPVVQASNPGLVLPEMILVKGGTFMMGCTEEQGDCSDNEKPAHKVTVKDFKIGKYPVTQAEWKAVMGANPSLF